MNENCLPVRSWNESHLVKNGINVNKRGSKFFHHDINELLTDDITECL